MSDLGQSIVKIRGPLEVRSPAGLDRFLDGYPAGVALPGAEEEWSKLEMDFLTWPGPTVDVASPGTGGWRADSVDAGGDAGEVIQVVDAGLGGILKILANDADNDATFVRQVGAGYKYQADKKMFLYMELGLSDADDMEILAGLIPEDANADTIDNEPADGIYVFKDETATQLDVRVKKDSGNAGDDLVGPTLADGTPAAPALVHVGFKVVAGGALEVWMGASYEAMEKVQTVAAGSSSLPDDEELVLAFGLQNGDTAADFLLMRRLLFAYMM